MFKSRFLRLFVLVAAVSFMGSCIFIPDDGTSTSVESGSSDNGTSTSGETVVAKGNVVGSVKDAVTLTPLMGVSVSLQNDEVNFITETESDGSYKFLNIPVGTYTISFEKAGYIPATGNVNVDANSTVTYPTLMQISEEDIGESVLNGLVKDATTGYPLTGVDVKIYEGVNVVSGEPYVSAVTDSAGGFSVNIEAGYYTVVFNKDGYSVASYPLFVIGNSTISQEFTISPVLEENEVRIVLTWGENPADLDSHLVKLKDGEIEYHLYYPYAGGSDSWDEVDLDVDDTTSFGPETITIYNLDTTAVYKYYVHDFSTYSGDTSMALANSGATVRVYWGDNNYTFNVPNLPGTAWKVFEIVDGELISCTGEECVFGVSGDDDAQFGTRLLDFNDVDLFRNLPVK